MVGNTKWHPGSRSGAMMATLSPDASKVLMRSQGGVNWISSGHKPVVLGHPFGTALVPNPSPSSSSPSPPFFPGAAGDVVFRSIPSGHNKE